VRVQADNSARLDIRDVGRAQGRAPIGRDGAARLVLNGLAHDRRRSRAMRYNGFLSADINVGPAPGLFDGPGAGGGRAASPPRPCRGFGFEWTELTYQEILAGNTAIIVFPPRVLLVFLVLAALYESLTCRSRSS
jgi:multidrug efflux pump